MSEPAVAVSTPRVVVWEAYRELDPRLRARDELSTLEAVRLLNEIRCFGRVPVLLVGLPLRRPDLGVLIEHGARIGLALRLSPGTDELTEDAAEKLRDEGLTRVVLDADLRARSLLTQEITRARREGLGVHVRERVTTGLLDEFAARGRELAEAGVHVWTLVFDVSVEGEPWRGDALDTALRRIIESAAQLPLHVEIEGAPQVQRVLREAGVDPATVWVAPAEGEGLMYIGADGTLQPSARLPLPLGNARQEDVFDTYHDSHVLCALRDPGQLHGKCGRCEYADVCGGDRARAQALTGDPLGPDPACVYRPHAAAGEQPA